MAESYKCDCIVFATMAESAGSGLLTKLGPEMRYTIRQANPNSSTQTVSVNSRPVHMVKSI